MWRSLLAFSYISYIVLGLAPLAQAQNAPSISIPSTRIPTTTIPTTPSTNTPISIPTTTIPTTPTTTTVPSQVNSPILIYTVPSNTSTTPSTQQTTAIDRTTLPNSTIPITIDPGILQNPNRNPLEPPNPRISDRYPESSSVLTIDPSVVINLIQSLKSSTNSQPNDIDTCNLADIRDSVSRLYRNLANQYLIQNQVIPACSALDNAYIAQLESYVCRGLPPARPVTNDCHAGELQRISDLTGSRTGLIYPVVFSDRIEIIFVTPSVASLPQANGSKQFKSSNQAPIRRIVSGVTPANVNRTIQEFRDKLSDPTLSMGYLSPAQELYNWIVRPVEKEIADNHIETLVFVMDGDLRVVPPAAFHDGQQYLVEKYATTSVTALPITNLDQRDRSGTWQILAMGLSEAVQGFSALPAVKTEVETIATQVLKGTTFLDPNFTIGNLQNQYEKHFYNVVHLASHAEFNAKKFSDSFILFWDDKLRLDKISNLKLAPDMLTLSACRTAVGQNLGLGGVAARSGAKSVLASLWLASDLGTAPLMISFYSNFSSAPSKAIALRNAQLALLHGQVKLANQKIQGIKGITNTSLSTAPQGTVNFSHPFYWANFILVGNWL